MSGLGNPGRAPKMLCPDFKVPKTPREPVSPMQKQRVIYFKPGFGSPATLTDATVSSSGRERERPDGTGGFKGGWSEGRRGDCGPH